MRLFALNASREFGERVAAALGVELAAHEEREFEDGEHKVRPLLDVQGEHAVIVQSLHGTTGQSGDQRLCRLLFFAGALRDHGAARVTAAVPYLAYGRKDRRTKPGDPVTTRYVAQLMEAIGIDTLVTLEAHNVAALQNAFRIPTVHLEAADVFVERALALIGAEPAVVMSPDPGGVKRAQLFRELLEERGGRSFGSGYLEKRRSEGVLSGSLLAGEVRGSTVLMIDDLISTGSTLARAAQTCLQQGARRVLAFAAHGLFSAGADAAIADSPIERIVISDSVPVVALGEAARAKVEVLSAAPLFSRSLREVAAGPAR